MLGTLGSRLGADARVAVRVYRRSPGFTASVILTLALCVGASTSIFSVVDAVLLRPLPYARPDRLVTVRETRRETATPSRASYPELEDWRAERTLFAALEAYDGTNVTLSDVGSAEMLGGARVTPGFFEMLGVAPWRGRAFTLADDVDGANAVVLSYGLWMRRFGADPAAVGRTITIDGAPYEIRGVLPSTFHFAPAGNAELWLPLGRDAQTRAQRSTHWLNVVGRLRDGVTLDQARRRMNAVMAALAARYPETNAGRGALVTALRDEVVGGVRRPLLVLFGAIGIVLLIACANIASLLLARTSERDRELAIRAALGARRRRVIAQLLAESMVLALPGALLGAALAGAGVRLLVALVPPVMLEQVPALRGASVDVAALAFAVAAATLGGFAVGLAPAIVATRVPATETLRSGTRAGASRGASRLRRVLVTAELALTVMLLVGAGLLARSFAALLRVDPGFAAAGVATVRAALSGPRYADEARQVEFFRACLARVRALPGVASVGAASSPPLQGSGRATFDVVGAAQPLGAPVEAATRTLAGDYVGTLRIPVREGRPLDERDRAGSPRAVVINETLARRLSAATSARSALGLRLRFRGDADSAWAVVGVVGDVKTGALDEPAAPTIYLSYLQAPPNRMSIMARTTLDPSSLIAPMRRAVHSVDPGVALYAEATLSEQVARSPAVAARRYPLVLIGAFAAAALLLAVIGVYGVVAYSIAQRRREIAIRLALGARDADVVSMFVRGALWLLARGVVVGALGALLLSRTLASLLFGVGSFDGVTYAGVIAALAAVTLLASYLPARRISSLDPAVAFRSE